PPPHPTQATPTSLCKAPTTASGTNTTTQGRGGHHGSPSAEFFRQAPPPSPSPAARSTSLSAAPTVPSGRERPRTEGAPGPAGKASAERLPPAQGRPPPPGATGALTSSCRAPTTSCGINRTPAPGLAGNPSAEH
ncbi:MAG: hypothetical protein ACXV5N_09095, partial [Halobacteriota archaeon]